jgi:hypothetical protein
MCDEPWARVTRITCTGLANQWLKPGEILGKNHESETEVVSVEPWHERPTLG